MACSDNVIRAGLTPKPKDVETLIQVLSLESSVKKIQPLQEDTCTKVFRPPILEFAVAKITVSFDTLPFNVLMTINDRVLLYLIVYLCTFILNISQLPAELPCYTLKPRMSASILLIVIGKAKISSKIFSHGSILFIPANDVLEIEVLCNRSMLMFQAFVNI